jgi:quinolinate synthase
MPRGGFRHADFIGSTSEIIAFARDTDADELLIGTESEIVSRLRGSCRRKSFIPYSSAFICPNMKNTR